MTDIRIEEHSPYVDERTLEEWFGSRRRQPIRPRRRQRPIEPIVPRFWANVTKTATCWYWLGQLSAGYGVLSIRKRSFRAHRIALALAGRAVPPGMVIDHLCRNRRCVNPDHLDIVGQSTNVRRGVGAVAVASRSLVCKRGHPWTPENTYYQSGPKGGRACRACHRDREASRKARLRGQAA